MEKDKVITTAQIQAILQFLSRTQISGAEAMVMIECVQTLQRILDNANPQSITD